MKSLGYPIWLTLAPDVDFEVGYGDADSWQLVYTGHTTTGEVDIAPILRDFMNAEQIELPPIEDINTVASPTQIADPYGMMIVAAQPNGENKWLIVFTPATVLEEDVPVGSILVARDYNFRYESDLVETRRLTSKVIGSRADSRQLIFASGRAGGERDITFCKTYDVETIGVIYTLDYAEPFSVTVQYEPGQSVTLPTPDELGFVLPSTHTFEAWTYLGQDVTEIIAEPGMVIEGRIERQPGANLIRGSRFGSPIKEGGTLDESADIRIPLSGSIVQLQEYAEIRASTISVSAYPRPQSINRTYVWSMVSNTDAGNGRLSSNKPDVEFLKAWVNGELVFNNESAPDIDGLFPSTSNHIIEILFTSEQPWLASDSVAITKLSGGSVRASLFKLEDVTGIPENEQRATAWVPHVDDPEV